LLACYLIGMAVLAWLTVFSGAYPKPAEPEPIGLV
jgi:hypothetical protein